MEVWKDVENYEGCYQVSNLGNVKSLDRYVQGKHGLRIHKGKILNGSVSEKVPYCVVNLANAKMKLGIKNKLVHRLVAVAFVSNPEGKELVNHINGNKLDNRAENLEWCTAMENIHHAINTGLTQVNGEKHHSSKLKDIQAIEVRKRYSAGDTSYKKLGDEFNVDWGVIRRIVKNRSYTHV